MNEILTVNVRRLYFSIQALWRRILRLTSIPMYDTLTHSFAYLLLVLRTIAPKGPRSIYCTADNRDLSLAPVQNRSGFMGIIYNIPRVVTLLGSSGIIAW
jgi:hypothetical protein